MRNSSYVPHYAISRYYIREFNTGAEPLMLAMIFIYYFINLIDLDGTNRMSSFDKKSLKKINIKSTITHECYTYNSIKSNSYLNIPSIQNENTHDKFSNVTYEVFVPSK